MVLLKLFREPNTSRAEKAEEQTAEEGNPGGEAEGKAKAGRTAETAAAATAAEQDKEPGSRIRRTQRGGT